MLVLRRRAGEAIVIGADIEIEVIEISRTRVKLGVRAPRTLYVGRREALAVAAENQVASGFFSSCGPEAAGNLARILQKISTETAQSAPRDADM